MKVYGYARVSTPTQSLERQVRNIKTVDNDAYIYQESYTGTTMDRPEWNKLCKRLRVGDTIIFDSVSRMSRDAEGGIAVYEKMMESGINLVFIKEPHINTSVYQKARQESIPATGIDIADVYIEATNKVLKMLARNQIRLAFEQAQKEVDDLRQRTKEGIVTARLNGKQIGRVQGSTVVTQKGKFISETILKKSKDFGGKYTDKELMAILGCSVNTFYKYKRLLRDA